MTMKQIIHHVKKRKEHYLLGTLLLTVGFAVYASVYFFNGASAAVESGGPLDPCTDQGTQGGLDSSNLEYSVDESTAIDCAVAADAWCGNTGWDTNCVSAYSGACGGVCGGGGAGGGGSCGDGIVDAAEQCDDGKHCEDGVTVCTADVDCIGIGNVVCATVSGDGCDAFC